MARNAEKAMTTLARWRAAKEAESGEKDRRPYLASECTDLPKCEKYRLEIIREISKKVSQIQNAGLGEFRIRDLNDEINKLLREKRHWENQISALGGPHYRRYGPKMFDAEGREVPGNRGYKYFGAAKDLPGVRELFEQEPPPPQRKTRTELMKDIDAEYYGYRDDDDGILIPLEERIERAAIQDALKEWKEKMARDGRIIDDNEDDDNIYPISGPAREAAAAKRNDEKDVQNDPMELLAPRFTAHVPVPTQKDIEEALLKKRKEELLKKYAGGGNLD
ncbi:pre-mRNA-splicing factor ISY1 homolog [Teleopsis dalmanni]|uniref:pre-mRNA-splicing factor ISY1 homolog n=1 Tax=Teleopsis dalmanni TaxID=139649 RepID=UPI0018CFAB67|nr:pre-mRNA-splicing factor ISY1 homolog [Teleopsis dalmanni]XP_037952668.1 pre-mRNA-splicing factor ISY1 homolog [Teleopsis dalmanni]XP_037953946.1 pre-mRNA-splicing factor ISY1 homolog [Teleopsis dalmanni]